MNFTCFFLNVAIRKYKITHVVCICGSDYNYHIGQCFSRGNGKMRKFERSSHLEKKLSNLKDKKTSRSHSVLSVGYLEFDKNNFCFELARGIMT